MADDTATRLTAKGRATRARILDTAAELILKHGVAGTAIDDVRKAAGVSGSQMTHYFRDKDTLVHEVIARAAETTLSDHQAPELDGFSTFASLRLWGDLILERQRQRNCQGGCNFGSLAGQLVESNPDSRPDFVAGFQQWLDLFRTGLRKMQATGDLLDDADPDELAYALLTSMQGGMLLAQTLRDTRPLDAAFNTALTRILAYASDPVAAGRDLRLKPSRRH